MAGQDVGGRSEARKSRPGKRMTSDKTNDQDGSSRKTKGDERKERKEKQKREREGKMTLPVPSPSSAPAPAPAPTPAPAPAPTPYPPLIEADPSEILLLPREAEGGRAGQRRVLGRLS